MLTKDALKFFGGSTTRLAKAAGTKIPTVYSWGETVPERRAYRLQVASGGVLKYDPDFYDAKAKAKSLRKLKNANHSKN